MTSLISADSGSFKVKDYIGWQKHVREMKVPAAPSLYIWTREIPEGSTGLAESLTEWLDLNLRTDLGRVGPYSSVQVTVKSPPLSANKVQQYISFSERDSVAWIRDLSTQWQRPLYIGITTNLRQRISNHLSFGSRLRGYMSEIGMEPVDCRVNYFNPPISFGTRTWDDPNEEGIDTNQESPLPPDLVKVLRLTEALLIRVAQPYLNQSME